VDYRKRKQMSAAIFHYLMNADDDKQKSMGVSIVREVKNCGWTDWKGIRKSSSMTSVTRPFMPRRISYVVAQITGS